MMKIRCLPGVVNEASVVLGPVAFALHSGVVRFPGQHLCNRVGTYLCLPRVEANASGGNWKRSEDTANNRMNN